MGPSRTGRSGVPTGKTLVNNEVGEAVKGVRRTILLRQKNLTTSIKTRQETKFSSRLPKMRNWFQIFRIFFLYFQPTCSWPCHLTYNVKQHIVYTGLHLSAEIIIGMVCLCATASPCSSLSSMCDPTTHPHLGATPPPPLLYGN